MPDVSSMPPRLTLAELSKAVSSSAAAFRVRRRLQPGGGAGDKVFPPTYVGAVYAVEERRVPGREDIVRCVLLDSVQSQANRMEEALQDAIDAGEIAVPLVTVDFNEFAPTGDLQADEKAGRLLDAIGTVTSLQVPHRLSDAILRDSELDGVRFRESAVGRTLNQATPLNATPVFKLCPTALVFGMWDSTGPKGASGTRFERTIVSEVVGFGVSFGVKTVSRIDPIITATEGIVLYQRGDGSFTLDKVEARLDKEKKPVKFGKKGKGAVSEANLGNVTPSFAKYLKGAEGLDPMRSGKVNIDYSIRANGDEFSVRNRSLAQSQTAQKGNIAPGGVTIEYAEQITTLSLIALRRLRFPLNGKNDPKVDAAARTVLAALALCSATLAFESGMGLRSRCLLWPEEPMEWELLEKPGKTPRRFRLEGDDARKLLSEAVAVAEKRSLEWPTKPIELKPSGELLKLVRRSQQQAVRSGAEAERD